MTTRVSNPICSHSFRISASVTTQIIAFAFGVPYNISTFYRYTINSIILYITLENQYLIISHKFYDICNLTWLSAYIPFTPIFIPENTWAPRILCVDSICSANLILYYSHNRTDYTFNYLFIDFFSFLIFSRSPPVSNNLLHFFHFKKATCFLVFSGNLSI